VTRPAGAELQRCRAAVPQEVAGIQCHESSAAGAPQSIYRSLCFVKHPAQLLSERMMNAVLTSALPTLEQLVATLPSPAPCLRLDQQNLPLLHEQNHPAAAAVAVAAVECVVESLIRFMSKELPPTLSVLLASGTPPPPLLPLTPLGTRL
jgi:hypothetical protein